MALQQGATCWFFSYINGMLMSTGGMNLLKIALIRYKSSLPSELRVVFNQNETYITRDSKFNFYKWLDQWITHGRKLDVCSKTLIRQILPQFRNTINQYEDPTPSFITFLNRIGLSDSTNIRRNSNNLSNLRRDLLLFPIYPDIRTTITREIENYKLSFSAIGLILPNQNIHGKHAIAGVVIRGSYFIIDSNRPTSVIACDWRDLNNVMTSARYRSLCRELYRTEPSNVFYCHVCFVRQYATGIKRKLNSNILNIKMNKTHNNNNGIKPMNTGTRRRNLTNRMNFNMY
jgi:hypothetical protein